MPFASERQPVPLDQLRQRSQELLSALDPNDYSIRIWINSARKSFETADACWREGRATNDGRKVEEAFLQYKSAAGVLNLLTHHGDFANLKRAKSPEYYTFSDLSRMVKEAKQPLDEVIAWLAKRDAGLVRQNGKAPPGPAAASNETPYLSSFSSRTSSIPVRPEPPAKTPSYPTTSLADRLAALKSNGLKTAEPAPPSHRSHNSISSAASTSPKSSSAPSLPSSSPRLGGIAVLRSPPVSPRARRGDLVEDDAVERSGSAPPVLPYSDVQEPATVWGENALQFRREGGTPIASREHGILDRGPAGGVSTAPDNRGPHSELGDVPSPSKFNSSFPSLDDFEKQVDAISTPSYNSPAVLPSFPSAPTYDPSSSTKPNRPPPPNPPRPKDVDPEAFEREQRARSERMAKVAAEYSQAPSASSAPAPAPNRNGVPLPSALVPGGRKPASSPAIPTAPSTSPLPPPTAASTSFSIPFSTDVQPKHLYQYLRTAQAEKGRGPRVLLLDVRSRDEYERARIKGETVCIEPVSLRNGIKGSDIEDSLSLAPRHEAANFASRQHFDLIVVYDRSSTSFPNSIPTSTSSEAQRVLWNLWSAIYEREFAKPPKRQPLLLTGGWEAWEKQVGVDGIVGTALQHQQSTSSRPRAAQDEVEAKQAHRRAAVLPSVDEAGRSVLTNGSSSHHQASTSTTPAGYFSSSNGFNTGSSSSSSATGLISPRLAMPPAAAQRFGTAPSYDPFAAPPHTSRPSFPQQPLDGYSLSTSPAGSPSMPRTRSDAVDLRTSNGPSSMYGNDYSRSSFDYSRPSGDYARPTIDYPQLQSRAPATVSQGTRPPPPAPYPNMPPVPLARPPPAKPAPVRSNSSFSSLQPAQYSSAHSRFPTNYAFEEGVVGLSGLKNLGNTCYMNSTIQCLSAAIPFAKYFTSGVYRKDVNTVNPLGTKGALANAVAELIRMLWAQQYNFLSPVTFREQICRVATQFRGTEQHDAQEFLGFLLDGLHEDCNYVIHKPPPVEMTPEREHDLETLPAQIMSEREWQIYKMRNDSFIVQGFQGQFRNQLRCLTCQKTSTTYNTFMPLSVPIPGGRGISKVSLMACLEQFVRDEILDKDDAWFCPRCKKNRKAVKKLSLSKLPPILVIHLKRFSFHGPFSDKIETQVQYPLSGLDLTAFVPPPLMDQRSGASSTSASPKYVYDLFGVTNHYGNLSSGHYTAFVRSGREWFNIGDSKVTPCDPNVVQSAKSAYILYYAMRT
ncbi:hypothetical protein JCM8547_008617 [Rhodosporidiobolus lusitaniae]